MPITEAELADLLEAAYDAESGTVVEPSEARRRIAVKQANAIAQFVIGRETQVTGTSVSGGAVTGTGIIQE